MKRQREYFRLTAKPVGPLLETLVEPSLRVRGFIGSELLLAWKAVLSPELRQEAKPHRLLDGRATRQAVNSKGRSLEVRCSEGAYFLLLYQKDQLIEKINQRLGRTFLTDLKFVKQSRTKVHSKRAISPSDHTHLSDRPSRDLDEALARLKRLPGRPGKA